MILISKCLKVLKLVAFFWLISLFAACSHNNAVETTLNLSNDSKLPFQSYVKPDSHQLAGIWQININPHDKIIFVTPVKSCDSHFNVTQVIPPPEIELGSDPTGADVLDIDVTITNPFPIDVFDVRGIVFSDNIGHYIKNNDGWTPLFDIPGGLPINSFKAFCRDIPSREFQGLTENTENIRISCPNENYSIQYAVEVSFPANCQEPYEITNFGHEPVYDIQDSQGMAQVYVSDWQDDINAVYLYCPVFTNTTLVSFEPAGAHIWETNLINVNGLSSGNYQGYLIVTSENSGNLALYDDVTLKVSNSSADGWAESFGGEFNEKAVCTALDLLGNIYVSGYYYGTVDFDPGSGIDLHTSNGEDDIFLCKYDNDGNFIWAKTWGSVTNDRSGTLDWDDFEGEKRGIAADQNDNIYVGGSFRGIVDFDPGPDVTERQSNGGCDIFLSKFNSDGTFEWVVTFGGTKDNGFENCYDIYLYNSNYLYLTGCFTDIVDFDPSSGQDIQDAGPRTSVFLSKYDLNGHYYWTRSWGYQSSLPNTMGKGVACDINGNIFVTGTFRGAWVDFDPGPGEVLYTSSGWCDAFLSKFSEDGDFSWVKVWGGAGHDVTQDIVVDNSGNCFIAGDFDGSVDFDPGPGTEIYSSDSGFLDCFVLKLDNSGEFSSVIVWGSPDVDTMNGISLDNSEVPSLLITCRFSFPTDFNPGFEQDWHYPNGLTDAALCKFGTDMSYSWTRTWGSEGRTYIIGPATDKRNDIYVTGNFTDTIDFDPGDNVDEHTSLGKTDVYIMKVLSNGYWE
jgi:hypothetical protein